MELGVFLVTMSAYALAIYLWWSERAPNYVVGLLAGHFCSLLSPLWQKLYGFSYDERFPILLRFGYDEQLQAVSRLPYALPRPVFLGAWTIMLAPLAIFYLFRHRWWFPSYMTTLLTFVLFTLYHLLAETIGVRQEWWHYTELSALPLDVPATLLSALMNGLVSLALLAALLLTRRYALLSMLLILLPMPLALMLFVYGVLGAPLYLVLLLQAQSWAGVIGLVGTLGMVLSGVHIVAGSLDLPRDARQPV
jgi:hypothetical protein